MKHRIQLKSFGKTLFDITVNLTPAQAEDLETSVNQHSKLLRCWITSVEPEQRTVVWTRLLRKIEPRTV